MQPTHVVVDTSGGYTWAFDADGKPFVEATAGRFAVARNSEMKPPFQTYRVFALTPADPFVVSDSWELDHEGRVTVLGRFPDEQSAAEFIGGLYAHEDGRYNLDGPADDW